MPTCARCPWLDAENVACMAPNFRGRRGNVPIRHCDMAVEMAVAKVASGDVLEVGFGKNTTFCRYSRKAGATWFGLEPRRSDDPSSNVFNGSVTAMPFGDGRFDMVVAFQSLEHWGEDGEVRKGLSEVRRVLKPGGRFVATVPMNSHGNRMAVFADVPAIVACFGDGWGGVRVEEWRRDPAPLGPYMAEEKHIKDLRKELTPGCVVTQWMIELDARTMTSGKGGSR